MIGKLYKQMMKDSAKTIFSIILISFLALTAPTLLQMFNMHGPMNQLAYVLYIVFLVGSHIAIFLIIIYRDYQNMFADRAYFYRSIPASGRSFTAARTLYYISYHFIAVVSVILQLLLLGLMTYWTLAREGNFPALSEVIGQIWTALKPYIINEQFPRLVLFILTGTLLTCVSLPMNVSLGTQERLNRYGIGGPIIVGVIFSFINSIINFLIEWLSGSLEAVNTVAEIGTASMENGGPDTFIASIDRMPTWMILIELLLILVCWGITTYSTDHKIALR